VDPETFNITAEAVEAAITPRTKAIVPVHLFGQRCDMKAILALAQKHNLYVIEDNAQAIGARDLDHTLPGLKGAAFSCTSFFPSKNLGCYGDGGALATDDDELAAKARMIANHGQSRQYYHDRIGVNSRLDAIQAAILNVKLPQLDRYNAARQRAAAYYDAAFSSIPSLKVPGRAPYSSHVFHQYTLRVTGGSAVRDALKAYLGEQGIPAMIYYPVPLYKQEAFKVKLDETLFPVTEQLCASVISLPMHSELSPEIQDRIITAVRHFFEKNA
jgi:UDP-2-acetamido-2-deoxy-ribo-hexuluronate aminotransferase